MFETSLLLFIKSLAINIFLPLIPWLLFVWIFWWKKFQWILLYLLSWFLWVWIVAVSLFNIQFIHFGVGLPEYFVILLLLLAIFVAKILVKKQSIKQYFSLLSFDFVSFSALKKSYFELSRVQKIFTITWIIFSLGFVVTIFTYRASFPTYADDSFGNRNSPAINVYQDWWVKLFWDKDQILARWRIGYPFYIPMYKALIADAFWSFNDIYLNTWQLLVFVGLLLFSLYITWKKTKNIFYTVLPSVLICWLPLVFFHSVEGYMDLPLAIYAVFAIWTLFEFVESNYEDISMFSLFVVLWWLIVNIKNEWLVIYLSAIVLSFIFLLVVKKDFQLFFKKIFKKSSSLLGILASLVYIYLPFLIVRLVHGLWLNPVSSPVATSTWFVSHTEIFSVFGPIFFKEDNYNVALLILLVILILNWKNIKNIKHNKNLFWIAPLILFVLFTLTFLFTENYQWALNQTTINRVYTMCFVVLFSFIWILFADNEHGKD